MSPARPASRPTAHQRAGQDGTTVGTDADADAGTGAQAQGGSEVDPGIDAGVHTVAVSEPIGRPAVVVGGVEFRQGDGTNMRIPPGACVVRLTALDATLSWLDGSSHGLAAMPLADFQRHVAAGRIVELETAEAAQRAPTVQSQ